MTRCTLYGPVPRRRTLGAMIRWLLVIFLALLLFNGLHAWLERIGLGRLPGDFRFRVIFLPIASTVLLSVIAALIAKLV
jgi:Protein of unknown function (DUF2905)